MSDTPSSSESARPRPAREDYAKLHANTSGPGHQGQTSQEAQEALDEIDSLRERLRMLNLLIDTARQLKVSGEQSTDGYQGLMIDACAVDDTRGTGIVQWLVWPDPDDPTVWNHPQSHYDQHFPLADVLLGIASVYVDREQP